LIVEESDALPMQIFKPTTDNRPMEFAGFALSVVGFAFSIAALNRRLGPAVQQTIDGPVRGRMIGRN
jgi:hypothetical protein